MTQPPRVTPTTFRVLTEENKVVRTDCLPMRIDYDLRYTVMEHDGETDFLTYPLMFLRQSRKARVRVVVGQYEFVLPLDWSILIADRDHGVAELVTVEEAIGRNFTALCLNPWSGLIATYLPLKIEPIDERHPMHSPQISNRQLLAIPLHDGEQPLCVYAAQAPFRFPSTLDIADLFS